MTVMLIGIWVLDSTDRLGCKVKIKSKHKDGFQGLLIINLFMRRFINYLVQSEMWFTLN